MFIGRILGALIGYMVAGPLVAIVGFLAGLFFDKGFANINQTMNPDQKKAVEKALFDAVFPVMGRLAKSDGHISKEEVTGAEILMSRMGLDSNQRNEAIGLFKLGAEEDFDVRSTIDGFLKICGKYNNIKQIFLVYLITIAYADDKLHEEEEKLLHSVADQLGYSRLAFNHLIGMIQAQSHFYQGQQDQAGYRRQGFHQQKTTQNELALAYQALGVDEGTDDKELKKAYRKLMSEYHPDKLQGRGVPDDMVKLATERSQEIQSAYDLLKKHRKS